MIRPMNYLGLDVHKRTISYCLRHPDGRVLQEGSIPAQRDGLDMLLAQLPGPCLAGMEATLFTAWVYDHLSTRGIPVKVAHPAMLKAIFTSKRKNDEIDAQKLADLLRCNYFPGVLHGQPRDPRSPASATVSQYSGCAKALKLRTKWLAC